MATAREHYARRQQEIINTLTERDKDVSTQDLVARYNDPKTTVATALETLDVIIERCYDSETKLDTLDIIKQLTQISNFERLHRLLYRLTNEERVQALELKFVKDGLASIKGSGREIYYYNQFLDLFDISLRQKIIEERIGVSEFTSHILSTHMLHYFLLRHILPEARMQFIETRIGYPFLRTALYNQPDIRFLKELPEKDFETMRQDPKKLGRDFLDNLNKIHKSLMEEKIDTNHIVHYTQLIDFQYLLPLQNWFRLIGDILKNSTKCKQIFCGSESIYEMTKALPLNKRFAFINNKKAIFHTFLDKSKQEEFREFYGLFTENERANILTYVTKLNAQHILRLCFTESLRQQNNPQNNPQEKKNRKMSL